MSKTGSKIDPTGVLLLVATSIGWGLNWPVTKHLLTELPPLSVRGLSGIVGAVLLALLALAFRQSLKVPRAQWARLVLLSGLNVTAWMALMGLALVYLPASEAAVMAYSMPVWASGVPPGPRRASQQPLRPPRAAGPGPASWARPWRAEARRARRGA